MRALMYSTRADELERYSRLNHGEHTLEMIPDRLTEDTATQAAGFEAVIVFVCDRVSAGVVNTLARCGVTLIICRSAGVDHVDLKAAQALGIAVAHCPHYSPAAIAEFSVGLLLALNRKIVLAHKRVLQHNFTIDPLLGIELGKSTVGIIGTGVIGTAFARLIKGFGSHILAYDPIQNPDCRTLGVTYCSFEKLLAEADIISLHTPLTSTTHYLINATSINLMKPGVLLINTARGAVVETSAVISAIEAGHIGGYAADVYEHECGVFFEDYRQKTLNDPILEKLLGMENVLLTPHQAFFTETALEQLATSVFENLTGFERDGKPTDPV